MLSVADARTRITTAFAPLAAEQVSLTDALGRVLSENVRSRRTQPPSAVSAMDGYAVRAADLASTPATLSMVGEVPAGQSFDRTIGPGETVRIFTGAPLPEGADAIVIQEDVEIDPDGAVRIAEPVPTGHYVRPAGLDFSAGDILLTAGTVLTARDVGLAAAMNVPWLMVRRQPRVAILATGDEVVMPGDPVGPNQIVSSNGLALAAAVRCFGASSELLGIAPDDPAALQQLAAGARGADLLITTGGASVGKHDLIKDALGDIGLSLDFFKIAMRPGKPLIFGNLGGTPLLGLPGNPVSSMVCALMFVEPAIAVMLGRPVPEIILEPARLAADLPANDRREDYLRANLSLAGGELPRVTPFNRQDSSMLSSLAASDCLIVRAPHAPAAAAGDLVQVLKLRRSLLSL